LRLCEFHIQQNDTPYFKNLLQKESEIVAFIWKQDKNACQQMGKEMIRLLSSLAKIPELQPMFQDLKKPNLITNQTLFY
jgi:Integrator complex subunit 3 N-terminal